MQNLSQELQETLIHEIPITRHLGITVSSYDGNQLVLAAPLEPNINHKQTAFAGSLNTLVTLAGWGLLWLVLQELSIPARIVIQDSTSNYLLPVHDDFSAICARPDSAQISRMVTMIKKRGRARVELHSEIRTGSAIAVSFKGRYVATLDER